MRQFCSILSQIFNVAQLLILNPCDLVLGLKGWISILNFYNEIMTQFDLQMTLDYQMQTINGLSHCLISLTLQYNWYSREQNMTLRNHSIKMQTCCPILTTGRNEMGHFRTTWHAQTCLGFHVDRCLPFYASYASSCVVMTDSWVDTGPVTTATTPYNHHQGQQFSAGRRISSQAIKFWYFSGISWNSAEVENSPAISMIFD